MRKLRIFTAKGDSRLEQKVIRCQTSAGKQYRQHRSSANAVTCHCSAFDPPPDAAFREHRCSDQERRCSDQANTTDRLLLFPLRLLIGVVSLRMICVLPPFHRSCGGVGQCPNGWRWPSRVPLQVHLWRCPVCGCRERPLHSFWWVLPDWLTC